MKLALALAVLTLPLAAQAADTPAPAASAAPAPTAVPAQAPAPAKVALADKDKRVCRISPSLGSNLPSRVCHTRAEWAEMTQKGNENAERSIEQRDRSGSGGGFNAGF